MNKGRFTRPQVCEGLFHTYEELSLQINSASAISRGGGGIVTLE